RRDLRQRCALSDNVHCRVAAAGSRWQQMGMCEPWTINQLSFTRCERANRPRLTPTCRCADMRRVFRSQKLFAGNRGLQPTELMHMTAHEPWPKRARPGDAKLSTAGSGTFIRIVPCCVLLAI